MGREAGPLLSEMAWLDLAIRAVSPGDGWPGQVLVRWFLPFRGIGSEYSVAAAFSGVGRCSDLGL